MYPTKHDAFLGAQKVGLHQALRVTAEAYEAHEERLAPSGRRRHARADRLLCSEPAHAHLTLVDTFGASPEAIEIRETALHAFAAYLQPGYELAPADIEVPPIAAEAVAGGIWQILHHYTEHERIAELPRRRATDRLHDANPFLGAEAAADVARTGRGGLTRRARRAAAELGRSGPAHGGASAD